MLRQVDPSSTFCNKLSILLCYNLLRFTTPVTGQFSRTKNAGKMVVRALLTLGIFGQEENMAEVVEVENVETQDYEFISEEMSRSPVFSSFTSWW